jgi:putative transposase
MNAASVTAKKRLIETDFKQLTIDRQCELVGLARSSFYYQPQPESERNLALMRRIDQLHLDDPTKGGRLLWQDLVAEGQRVNLKRVRRLMRLMALETLYCKPNLSKAAKEKEVHPYLLRHLKIETINQVWATDITYIPMQRGFLYLVAVIDWYSRFILGWRLSNTLSVGFCLDCLQACFERWGKPEIFNTDQGSQFTCHDWLNQLKEREIRISMDGKGRALDNIIIERFWRTLKYRYIYLHEFSDGWALENGLQGFMQKYCYHNKHQSLGYLTPAQVYLEKRTPPLKNAKPAIELITYDS